MIVFSYPTIKAFAKKHPEAEESLNNWYSIMSENDFANFNKMRSVFNSVDSVGNDRYVFNIKGNHFRLVAMIHFKVRTVYIRQILTHKNYDKIADISNI